MGGGGGINTKNKQKPQLTKIVIIRCVWLNLSCAISGLDLVLSIERDQFHQIKRNYQENQREISFKEEIQIKIGRFFCGVFSLFVWAFVCVFFKTTMLTLIKVLSPLRHVQ